MNLRAVSQAELQELLSVACVAPQTPYVRNWLPRWHEQAMRLGGDPAAEAVLRNVRNDASNGLPLLRFQAVLAAALVKSLCHPATRTEPCKGVEA